MGPVGLSPECWWPWELHNHPWRAEACPPWGSRLPAGVCGPRGVSGGVCPGRLNCFRCFRRRQELWAADHDCTSRPRVGFFLNRFYELQGPRCSSDTAHVFRTQGRERVLCVLDRRPGHLGLGVSPREPGLGLPSSQPPGAQCPPRGSQGHGRAGRQATGRPRCCAAESAVLTQIPGH